MRLLVSVFWKPPSRRKHFRLSVVSEHTILRPHKGWGTGQYKSESTQFSLPATKCTAVYSNVSTKSGSSHPRSPSTALMGIIEYLLLCIFADFQFNCVLLYLERWKWQIIVFMRLKCEVCISVVNVVCWSCVVFLQPFYSGQPFFPVFRVKAWCKSTFVCYIKIVLLSYWFYQLDLQDMRYRENF